MLMNQQNRQPLQEVSGYMQGPTESKRKGQTAQKGQKQLKKSSKLDQDPILELKHIIGYSPETCQTI